MEVVIRALMAAVPRLPTFALDGPLEDTARCIVDLAISSNDVR
ncbi:MAG: hypothetical protein ACLGI3_19435 [Actinomycetes bacterium]